MVKKRYLELDFIRGSAIILMVIFHFCFDLNYFGFIHIDIFEGMFWKVFRNITIFLFIISVGISLYIVNERDFNRKKNFVRLGKLFLVSLLITVVSYVIYPTTWIYFGIIHLIFVGSLIALPFVKIPLFSLGMGVLILLAYMVFDLNMDWLFALSQNALSLPATTQDIAHLFPWLGVIFIGVYIGYKKWFDFDMREGYVSSKVSFLGQHALVIYLVHQPVLRGVVGGINSYIS